MFVIRGTTVDVDKTELVQYWAYDRDSGYPYWTTYLPGAKFFTDRSQIEKELSSSDMTQNVIMSDGSIHPPRMVHSGANLSINKMRGSVLVEIIELQEKAVWEQHYDGDLRQKDTIKQYQAALAKLTPEDRKILGLQK